MKGDTIALLDFLEPSRTRFIIPLYQRNYDWKEEHCRQLLTDIVRIHKDNVESHFFGSIVTRMETMSSKNILIIDGQQRITTITLLMAALVKAYKDGRIQCADVSKYEIIWEDYLYEKHFEGRHFKLQPIEKDCIALDAILDDKPLIADSHITTNYQLFYNWVISCNLTLDNIYDAISKLIVIDIRLDGKDDPQLIFESINSTGLELSEADKIRNYFLMSLSAADQEKYYKEYWNPIEECTSYNPTMFIRDYLTLQKKKIATEGKLYQEFKAYITQGGLNKLLVLQDMLPYAREYQKVITANAGSKALNRKLQELCTLDSTIAMPFYTSFLLYADTKEMSDTQKYDVLDLIENYWARRIICGYPSNALNKVFSTLHSDILNLIKRYTNIDANPIEYIEALKYVLIQKQGTSTFPKDKEVCEKFQTRDIYHLPQQYRYFLFERMENQDGKEITDVVTKMKEGEVSIEHIMPQTLTPQWEKELGDDAREIHEKYLHTFGNLTLTGYNPNYSNRTFTEKRDGYVDKNGKHIYGFSESKFSLSHDLKDLEHWNEVTIRTRCRKLCKQFLQLWAEPKTNLKEPHNSNTIEFDPDNRDAFTGLIITAFTFNDKTYVVKSWREMMEQLFQILWLEYPSEIRELCTSKSSRFLSYGKPTEDIGEYTCIGDNCYIKLSNSTWQKMGILECVFDTCDINYSDLSFEYVTKSKSDSEI